MWTMLVGAVKTICNHINCIYHCQCQNNDTVNPILLQWCHFLVF